MANTITFQTNAFGVGESLASTVTRQGDGGISRAIALPQAYAGQLTTRTDDDTGEVTLDAGHAITTGMVVDIYWAGGVQYSVTVGTVATNAMPFDSGVGDNLPVNMTDVVVAPVETANVDFEGDNLKAMAVKFTVADDAAGSEAGHVQFLTASPSEAAEIDLVQNVLRPFDIEGGDTNHWSGESVATISASQANVIGAGLLQLILVEDTTP